MFRVSESVRKFVSIVNVVSLVFASVPTPALAATYDLVSSVSLPEANDVPLPEVTVTYDESFAAAVVDTGEVTSSQDIMVQLTDAGVKKHDARLMAASVLADDDTGEERDIPRSGDGSNVESLALWWVTEDTVDDGDSDSLYIRPVDDAKQQVRMRLNYALSGEFNYGAGDVRITIPDSMFIYRDGTEAGTLVIPYSAAPDASQDFMWEHVGNTYVLTNTRRMSAATKGFIEFAVTGLVPHKLVDMAPSDAFNAAIEVTTHYGNLIGLASNDLTARFDTEQVVDAAYKRPISSAEWVDADAIPEVQRVDGETEYVVATWDVYGHHAGNTEFTLDVLDEVLDEYHGFVIGARATDAVGTKFYDDVESGWMANGTFGHMTIKTAYPGSQFESDTDYVLEVIPGTLYSLDETIYTIDVVDGETYAIGEDGVVTDEPATGYITVEKLFEF